MTRVANILVLCATKNTIINYKSLKIIQGICKDTNLIVGCQYWNEINFFMQV